MVDTVNGVVNYPNLDYIRKGVQKIIDKHLDENDRFSVMDYNRQELKMLVDLLTGAITRDEVEQQYENDKLALNRVYDDIVCKYDFVRSFEQCIRNTKDELNALNSDCSLQVELDAIDNDYA